MWIGDVFDADPDLTFHIFADPEPDTIPSFTHAEKAEFFFLTFIPIYIFLSAS
jgi:hypothetical protein